MKGAYEKDTAFEKWWATRNKGRGAFGFDSCDRWLAERAWDAGIRHEKQRQGGAERSAAQEKP